MTKLEEIARAICASSGRNPDMIWDVGPDEIAKPDVDLEPLRLKLMQQARAAVEAMREPTSRMQSEGSCVDYEGDFDEAGHPIGLTAARNVWHAMIDAILNEKPEEKS